MVLGNGHAGRERFAAEVRWESWSARDQPGYVSAVCAERPGPGPTSAGSALASLDCGPFLCLGRLVESEVPPHLVHVRENCRGTGPLPSADPYFLRIGATGGR